jgi:uncharacterized membrane protein YfcA
MLTDPWFYAAAVSAIILTGISKGGFGGLGGLAVPILALAISPTIAAAIMLPILCVMDLVGIWRYRGRWDKANMRLLVLASLVGIGFGALTFRYMDADAIRLMIGAIAVIFALRYWLGLFARTQRPATKPSTVIGGICGALAGFTSFVAHAGAPPVAVYLMPQKLDKTVYHATTVVFFLAVNYVKLVPYTILGQFTETVLITAAVLFPLAIAGTLLGVFLHTRTPDRLFYPIGHALLLVTGGKLMWDGMMALL